MATGKIEYTDDFDLSFKVFHELMPNKVSNILLVSSPYDAFIMEEEGRLAERIIQEYRGLNLSRPPRLTWVPTAERAMQALSEKKFDFVMKVPSQDDMNPYVFGREIKEKFGNIPVFLLTHETSILLPNKKQADRDAIDKIFVWSGNADLLLALIKNVEDRKNISVDTQKAKVRVIIMVEDSPYYCSSLLPMLYKEIVMQTQAVMEESLNEEHRIFRMRARPKILVAENYEEAVYLFQQYKAYVMCVLSDMRFPRNGNIDTEAGYSFLSMIKKEYPSMPLLMLSSDEINRERALKIPAVFLYKNSPTLHEEIRSFFIQQLGFGDFIFRLPNKKEVARASNLRELEKILPSVPDESIEYHAVRNHFSGWLMARSEVMLASKLKPFNINDFSSVSDMKAFLISCIHERRKGRQKGIIATFFSGNYDHDADFIKIGRGSLGGKARGLAFVSTQLKENPEIQKKIKNIQINIPKTIVISTEGFDSFISENQLKDLSAESLSDDEIKEKFLKCKFPGWLRKDLESFLLQADYPIAIRSSSLLEDAHSQPFAGIYKTYMLPNNHADINKRLQSMIQAIKLVYASTYLEVPRSYIKSTMRRIEEEKMAVIVQKLTGSQYGKYFYPTVSGVAQSYNFYPISYMKPEEGISHIALGLGKTVVEGGTSLRFSPKYPRFLPQFSTVEDILNNSQRFFYALDMSEMPGDLGMADDPTLKRLEIDEVPDHLPIKYVSSFYDPQDNRIRDTFQKNGHPVLTFSKILKYNAIPLSELLTEILEMGRKGMGCPVEIEFAVDIDFKNKNSPEFALLQIRPMAFSRYDREIFIDAEVLSKAFCFSTQALGNGRFQNISDIVMVNPDTFDPSRTVEIASEIGRMNRTLVQLNRRYLLIGPGRWGSADRWLGIPVTWKEISGVGAIIETATSKLNADPSQGSHFFHNITSLGISYLTIPKDKESFIDWDWLNRLPVKNDTGFLKHIQLKEPITMLIDGKKSWAVILEARKMGAISGR